MLKDGIGGLGGKFGVSGDTTSVDRDSRLVREAVELLLPAVELFFLTAGDDRVSLWKDCLSPEDDFLSSLRSATLRLCFSRFLSRCDCFLEYLGCFSGM